MKASIDVTSRGEAEAIRSGLEDPEVRALLVIIGMLKSLPSGVARKRVMRMVVERMPTEDEEAVEA